MEIASQSRNKNQLTNKYAGIFSSLNNSGEKGALIVVLKSQGENKLVLLVGAAEQKTYTLHDAGVLSLYLKCKVRAAKLFCSGINFGTMYL